MILESSTLPVLRKALKRLEYGFQALPALGHAADAGAIENVLLETAGRLQDNFPYFHPLYAGQMLKPPHPVARLAYALSLWINPNNHALDGGRASSALEREATAALARMFGWKRYLGHLCGGGTMANLEALWIAGQLGPGKKIVASSQSHYTHQRLCKVLGLPFELVPCDRLGRMDVATLEKILTKGRIGTVVATIGTTATGAVDPLPELLRLRRKHDFRLHADAAYGGYFGLATNLASDARRVFDCLKEVDSIVVDPHKHGLQPYGCGCVLFRDPGVGSFYQHDSPYTYFSTSKLHLGEISLECSRPGAAAVALWATQKLLPMAKEGEFARMLSRSRLAALRFYEKLKADLRFVTAFPPELDIVVWIPRDARVSASSALSRRIFAEAAKRNLHLALANLPVTFFDLSAAGIKPDHRTVTCLRSVLMKPEHLDWLDRIWELLNQATDAATRNRSQERR
jgi:glutamate/tyrosine decarboxylase-like PLP-dependent enzyme